MPYAVSKSYRPAILTYHPHVIRTTFFQRTKKKGGGGACVGLSLSIVFFEQSIAPLRRIQLASL